MKKKDDVLAYMRAYREKNREKLRLYNREYNRLWRKKYGYKSEERWKKTHKIAIKAERILNRAIQKGIIKRQPCVICGEKKVVAHCPDYQKPIEVVFLCPVHHRNLHYVKTSYPQKVLDTEKGV